MELLQAEEATEELMQLLSDYLVQTNRGREIHVSDLDSPLQSWWAKNHPEVPYTPREIGLFVVGQGHHTAMVAAVANVVGTQEDSFVDEATGIHFSPDLVAYNGEFKTSRWWKIPETSDDVHAAIKYYYSQCRAYAAFLQDKLLEKNTWRVVVMFIVPERPGITAKYPEPRVWRLRWTDDELEDAREEMRCKADTLRKAMDANDPSSLALCAENRCTFKQGHGRGKPSTQEPLCRFFHMCKPAERYEKWKEQHPDD